MNKTLAIQIWTTRQNEKNKANLIFEIRIHLHDLNLELHIQVGSGRLHRKTFNCRLDLRAGDVLAKLKVHYKLDWNAHGQC